MLRLSNILPLQGHQQSPGFTTSITHIFANLKCQRKSSFRLASTIAPDQEVPFWPTSSSPTPYDILGVDSQQIKDKRLLKRKYRDLCKLYHPDISFSRKLLDHKGKELNDQAKESRFKQINSAYSLLSDPRKRNLYDRFKTGWDFTSNTHMQYDATSAAAYGTNPWSSKRYNTYDDQFWHAGNWEDYAHMGKDKEKEQDPIFKSELARKNKDVLILLIGVALVMGCAQVAYALGKWQEELVAVERTNMTSNNSLLVSYLNHGLGLDKWSRLNTFLWTRRYNMYSDDHEQFVKQEAEDKKLIKDLQDKELKKNAKGAAEATEEN